MKRTRENEPDGDNIYRGESPFLMQFEVVNGLTKKRAAAQEKVCDAAFRRLCRAVEGRDASRDDYDLDLAVLLADSEESAVVAGCCTNGSRKLLDSIIKSVDSASYVSFIGSVHLVANDGNTLFMASSLQALDQAASLVGSDRQMFHQKAQSALQRLRFNKQLGEVFLGDTLLIQVVENSTFDRVDSEPFTDHGDAKAPENDPSRSSIVTVNENYDKDIDYGYGDHLVTNAEFLTFNTDIFSSVDTWRDAVRSNLASVGTWMEALSVQPPGFPQLSYLQSCALGRKNSEGSMQDAFGVGIDGWARSLQLPLLLKVRDDLSGSLDRKTLDLLRRAILSVLRLFVSIFVHASAIMPLPNLYQDLFITFVASPLFLEGFSTVLSDTTGSIGSLTWGALTVALRDAISLCMHHVCHYTPAVLKKDDVGNFLLANASLSSNLDSQIVSAKLLVAIGNFETLMHRLSATWLLTNTPRPQASLNRHTHRFCKNQRVSEALEDLATQGVIQGVAQWLQYKELKDAKTLSLNSENSSHTQLDGAHGLHSLLRPPTLQQLEEPQFASEKTAEEELEAMRSTYTPYLTRDALRFVEAAARAAYAELYAPALQATRTFLASSLKSPPESSMKIVAVRVVAVRFPALQPKLSEHSWHDVRHHAEFGLPVLLEILPRGTFPSTNQRGDETEAQEPNASIQDLQRAIGQTAAADSFPNLSNGCSSEDGSCFANIIIRLQGRPVLFPVVMTNLFAGDDDHNGEMVASARVKAYVIQDMDMLAEFVRTSAAMEAPGLPDAWLITASHVNPEDAAYMGASLESKNLTRPPRRRLLPLGTPALTFMDIIKLFVMLRDELVCGMSYDALAVGKDKTVRWTAQHPHQQPYNRATKLVASLWLSYFATGELPAQQNSYFLSSANRAIAGDSGQAVVQNILQGLVESGPFTLAQVEALHSLCSSGSASTAGGSVLTNIRVAEGCVGGGKTTVLYTCSAVRGEQMAVARREHQSSLQPMIKDTTSAVKRAASELHAAVSVVAPFTDAEDEDENSLSPTLSPSDAEKNEETTLADAFEGLATAVEAQGVEFNRLSRGMRYCTPSLLLENDVAQEELPPSVIKLLHLPPTSAERRFGGEVNVESPENQQTRVAPLHGYQRCKMRKVVAESFRRASHAPLAATLENYLSRLQRLGNVLTSLQNEQDLETNGKGGAPDQDKERLPPLHLALLPLLMSGREVRELVAAADDLAASGSPEGRGQSWVSFIRDRLWSTTATFPAITARAPAPGTPPQASNGQAKGHDWSALSPRRSKAFEPVRMPSTMHLPLLDPAQAAGWWRVYAEKQVELFQHIRECINAGVRQVFRIFCDLVNGVSAVSQATKQQVIVCSEQSLFKNLNLPFLWVWNPSHIFIDDFEELNDAMLLALPSAKSITLSLHEKLPVYAERYHFHAAMVLLRSLRKELQQTAALSTAVLNEPLRCDKDVLQTVLAKLCTHDACLVSAGAEREDEEDEDVDSAGRDELGHKASENISSMRKSFPGFVSCSPLEVWTHSVAPSLGTEADAVAAAFVYRYLAQYNRDNSLHIFHPFKNAFRKPNRQLTMLNSENCDSIDAAAEASYAHVCVPWFEDTQEEAEFWHEGDNQGVNMECEVGVICLSSLAQFVAENRRQAATSSVIGGGQYHRNTRGSADWDVLLQEAEGIFHKRLCDWLWRALSRVRSAAIIIGTKELFMRIPVLQEMERFVVHQRRVLAPRNPRFKYWLPSKVAGSVLALCCPEHYKCRRIASVSVREEHIVGSSSQTGKNSCYVKILGEECCQTVCLHGFENCEKQSHVCLHPCHLTGDPAPYSPTIVNDENDVNSDELNTEKANQHDISNVENPSSPHAVCLYPCCKTLQCGHLCNRVCGAPCEPCRFVGLQELPCGQRVVSGINSTDMTIQYAFFAHFQKTRCGAPPQRCEILVTVSCPRCGQKSKLPCFQLTEHECRLPNTVKKHNRAGVESQSAHEGEETFVLSRVQCPGCVALYNKVASKHGLAELPMPVPESLLEAPQANQEEDTKDGLHHMDAPKAQDASASLPNDAQFPQQLLSADARRDLEHAFLLAKKKTELLLKKEALEISSGSLSASGSKISNYVVCRDQYNAQKAAQAQDEERWKALVNEQVQYWAQRLREQVEKQANMNARMENTWPLLVSEAEAELEKQQQSV